MHFLEAAKKTTALVVAFTFALSPAQLSFAESAPVETVNGQSVPVTDATNPHQNPDLVEHLASAPAEQQTETVSPLSAVTTTPATTKADATNAIEVARIAEHGGSKSTNHDAEMTYLKSTMPDSIQKTEDSTKTTYTWKVNGSENTTFAYSIDKSTSATSLVVTGSLTLPKDAQIGVGSFTVSDGSQLNAESSTLNIGDSSLKGVSQIVSGSSFSLALMTDGTVLGWGSTTGVLGTLSNASISLGNPTLLQANSSLGIVQLEQPQQSLTLQAIKMPSQNTTPIMGPIQYPETAASITSTLTLIESKLIDLSDEEKALVKATFGVDAAGKKTESTKYTCVVAPCNQTITDTFYAADGTTVVGSRKYNSGDKNPTYTWYDKDGKEVKPFVVAPREPVMSDEATTAEKALKLPVGVKITRKSTELLMVCQGSGCPSSASITNYFDEAGKFYGSKHEAFYSDGTGVSPVGETQIMDVATDAPASLRVVTKWFNADGIEIKNTDQNKLGFPAEVFDGALRNLSQAELAQFETAVLDINDNSKLTKQILTDKDGNETGAVWSWTSGSNNHKTYSLVQNKELVMHEDGTTTLEEKWNFSTREQISMPAFKQIESLPLTGVALASVQKILFENNISDLFDVSTVKDVFGTTTTYSLKIGADTLVVTHFVSNPRDYDNVWGENFSYEGANAELRSPVTLDEFTGLTNRMNDQDKQFFAAHISGLNDSSEIFKSVSLDEENGNVSYRAQTSRIASLHIGLDSNQNINSVSFSVSLNGKLSDDEAQKFVSTAQVILGQTAAHVYRLDPPKDMMDGPTVYEFYDKNYMLIGKKIEGGMSPMTIWQNADGSQVPFESKITFSGIAANVFGQTPAYQLIRKEDSCPEGTNCIAAILVSKTYYFDANMNLIGSMSSGLTENSTKTWQDFNGKLLAEQKVVSGTELSEMLDVLRGPNRRRTLVTTFWKTESKSDDKTSTASYYNDAGQLLLTKTTQTPDDSTTVTTWRGVQGDTKKIITVTVSPDYTFTNIQDSTGRLVKSTVTMKDGSKQTTDYLYQDSKNPFFNTETVVQHWDSNGVLDVVYNTFNSQINDTTQIYAVRGYYPAYQTPSYFFSWQALETTPSGLKITLYEDRSANKNFSEINALTSEVDVAKLASGKTLMRHSFDSAGKLNYENQVFFKDENGNWPENPSFIYTNGVTLLVVGKADKASGENDDINITNGLTVNPVGKHQFQAWIQRPISTSDYFQKAGIYIQSEYDVAFVEFPKENSFTLDGKKYDVTIDTMGAVTLTERLSPEDQALVNRVNDSKFHFDFDGDGIWTVNDYTLFKSFDGIEDPADLRSHLTDGAKMILDINKDGTINSEDVEAFGEMLVQKNLKDFVVSLRNQVGDGFIIDAPTLANGSTAVVIKPANSIAMVGVFSSMTVEISVTQLGVTLGSTPIAASYQGYDKTATNLVLAGLQKIAPMLDSSVELNLAGIISRQLTQLAGVQILTMSADKKSILIQKSSKTGPQKFLISLNSDGSVSVTEITTPIATASAEANAILGKMPAYQSVVDKSSCNGPGCGITTTFYDANMKVIGTKYTGWDTSKDGAKWSDASGKTIVLIDAMKFAAAIAVSAAQIQEKMGMDYVVTSSSTPALTTMLITAKQTPLITGQLVSAKFTFSYNGGNPVIAAGPQVIYAGFGAIDGSLLIDAFASTLPVNIKAATLTETLNDRINLLKAIKVTALSANAKTVQVEFMGKQSQIDRPTSSTIRVRDVVSTATTSLGNASGAKVLVITSLKVDGTQTQSVKIYSADTSEIMSMDIKSVTITSAKVTITDTNNRVISIIKATATAPVTYQISNVSVNSDELGLLTGTMTFQITSGGKVLNTAMSMKSADGKVSQVLSASYNSSGTLTGMNLTVKTQNNFSLKLAYTSAAGYSVSYTSPNNGRAVTTTEKIQQPTFSFVNNAEFGLITGFSFSPNTGTTAGYGITKTGIAKFIKTEPIIVSKQRETIA